ncbi:hypothetical protein [Hyalangium versicolor]|uniref:hypothetical protein n=1 Tax=Hyalangium versicolor TaxID=2861190 RepID=UPI001CC9C116|nr:hypothetical protein [Hyalangium versicolor]
MAAGMTSAAVRFWDALAVSVAGSVLIVFLLPSASLAATPGASTSALTPLEQELIVTPELRPSETRQPVLGYLRHTAEGWKLDMLPGAVTRTGPLPVLTSGADAAPEYPPSLSVYPYAPLFRVDF